MAHPSGQELVQKAMERLGASGHSDLARKLGLSGYTSPQRVRRWLEGYAEPRYAETLEILEKLGVLDWSKLDANSAMEQTSDAVKTQAADEIASAVSRGDYVEALRAAVEELAAVQTQAGQTGLEIVAEMASLEQRLGERLDSIERRLPEQPGDSSGRAA